MPPLRERTEDIPLLVNHFLQGFGRKRGMELALSDDAMQCLMQYDFPGNIRELKNIIERVSVLSPGPAINRGDLPADLHTPRAAAIGTTVLPLSAIMASAEKQCLINVLTYCSGNRTKAAGALGISRKNLWEKMKLHGIEL
jgi:two-component system response regulator AtoC